MITEPRIVNRIINNTVVTKGVNNTSALVQPVFYRTRPLGSVVIHPEVTENLAINLDAYKSVVPRFVLKIGGLNFNEIGRTADGVVFRIDGSTLDKKLKDGTLYVLDDSGVLVTDGKFTVER